MHSPVISPGAVPHADPGRHRHVFAAASQPIGTLVEQEAVVPVVPQSHVKSEPDGTMTPSLSVKHGSDDTT